MHRDQCVRLWPMQAQRMGESVQKVNMFGHLLKSWLSERELSASMSHPDRSRLRQSLASLREQYETLKQEHEKYCQQHAAEVQTLNEELDHLADERAKATEENRKALLQLEQEHVEQIRKLRSAKDMLDDDKHSMQQVRKISAFTPRSLTHAYSSSA
jgi:chromosome segregation ATPase